MDEIAGKMRGWLTAYGYDMDNIHATESAIAGAITAGDDKECALTAGHGSNFAKGDRIFLTGLTSGVRAWEFTEIKAISTDTITIDVTNSYDAASVSVYLVNSAVDVLRDLNTIGAAAMAEEAAFMGTSPNRSDHAEKLWERFYGSEITQNGIWALKNIAGYLYGATTTDDAISTDPAASFQTENPSDSHVENAPIFEMETEW
jgi:hypothetical protein